MKRKLIAIILIACMALVAVTGATLAYFTDNDAVKNEFAVGKVDIDLWEIVGYEDDEEVTVGKDTDTTDQYTYSNLFPTDEITKEVYVTNNDTVNSVYVRVTVVMNKLQAIGLSAIDEVYEAKGWTAEQIQAKYDEVFVGWGINYAKRAVGQARMWMDDRTGDGSPVLFNIDTIARHTVDYVRVDSNNKFMTDAEKAKFAINNDGILDSSHGDPDSYYNNAVGVDERAYIFYLEIPADTTYKLFDGLKVPADFTQEQAKMFDGLKIDVYADAIQTTGFATAEDAFNALNEQYPIGHWNET